MCGRFTLELPAEVLIDIFGATPANDLPEGPRWNICPTTQIPVVRGADAAGRRLVSMRWGFVPHWYKSPTDGPLLINARAETIAEKPAFRAAARARRCLIPATGFYEWKKDAEGNRLPWYFYPAQEGPMVFAGVWQDWGELGATCAIVTCAAGEVMAEVHHREPVTLAPEDWAVWLGETDQKAAPLMRASPEGAIKRHRVGRAVNSNRAEGAALVDPLIEE